jgi:amidase
MARFVSDLALTLPLLVGPDGTDSAVVPVPLAKRTPKLKGLKVAWYADDGIAKPTHAIATVVRSAVRVLADAGCEMTEGRPPGLHEAHQVTLGYWGDKRMSHDRLYKRWDAFRTLMLGFMSGFDLIVTPVAPDIAPLYRSKYIPTNLFSYTIPFSLTGNPCVVVRAGISPEGLPIGVQIVARNWHDDVALRAAYSIERALGGWRPASVVG